MSRALDVALAGVVFAAVAPLTLRKPAAGVVATIVVIGAASSVFSSLDAHMATIRWGALMGLLAGGLLGSRGRPFPWQGRERPLLLLALPVMVGLASAAWSIDAGHTIERAISFAMLVLAVGLNASRVDPHELARWLVGSAAMISIASLGLWAFDPERALLGRLLRGVFENPNGLGLMLALIFPFAVIHATTWRATLIRLPVVVLIAATIALSGSRTAIAAVAVGLLTLALTRRLARQAGVAGIAVAATVLAITMFPIKPASGGISGFLGTQDSAQMGRSRLTTFLGGRNESWSAAWRIVERRPLEGFGFGSGGDRLFVRFPSDVHFVWFQGGGPSNAYLELMMETGFLGAVLFLAPLGAAVALGLRRLRVPGADVWPVVLLAGSVTAAVFESTLTSAGAPWALFAWLAVAAILGTSHTAGKPSTPATPVV
jgi:O-antigen ligase